MFSLRTTVIVLLILGIPYVLRTKFGDKFEPFPAILLPAGASKAPVLNREFSVNYMKLLSERNDGSCGEVDARLLLSPLPPTNHKYVLARNFGLLDMPKPKDRLSRLMQRFKFNLSRNASEQDKKKAKRWLRENLQTQGFNGSAINIVQLEKVVSISDGQTLSEKIIYESIIYLD